MQEQIRTQMPAVELRDVFERMHQENRLVSVEDSANVLIRLLEEDVFENGGHVDYFDVCGDERVVGH